MDPLAVALLWGPLLSFALGQVSGYITRRWWPGLLVGLAIMLLMAVVLPTEARESAWPPIYVLAGLLGGGTGRSFRRLHERQCSVPSIMKVTEHWSSIHQSRQWAGENHVKEG